MSAGLIVLLRGDAGGAPSGIALPYDRKTRVRSLQHRLEMTAGPASIFDPGRLPP
jgi:hypothetical protein